MFTFYVPTIGFGPRGKLRQITLNKKRVKSHRGHQFEVGRTCKVSKKYSAFYLNNVFINSTSGFFITLDSRLVPVTAY